MVSKSSLVLVLATASLSALFALGSGCGSSSAGGSGGSGGAGSTASTTSTAASSSSSGAGGGTSCTSATVETDCGTSSDCLAISCIGAQCHFAPATKGASCNDDGGATCDGKGSCVPPHCISSTRDGAETGQDCGGPCPPCSNGQPCTTNDDCDSAFCGPGPKPNESMCAPCKTSVDCTADRYCDANSNRCVADKNVGEACAESAECPGTYCIEGVCCDSACDTTCTTCLLARGATKDGTCSPMTGAEDPGSCDASGGCKDAPCACSAAGQCASANGVACTDSSTCASGHCIDGVCCDTSCDVGCSACTLAKGADKDGTCKPTALKATQLAGRCDDTNGNCGGKCACDAAGACLRVQGEACSSNDECGTGFCADGVCCATTCDGTCMSCRSSDTGDADGTCAFIQVNVSDPGKCDETNGGCGTKCACGKYGECLRAGGEKCSFAQECTKGLCQKIVGAKLGKCRY
jgi:hypothetical protein